MSLRAAHRLKDGLTSSISAARFTDCIDSSENKHDYNSVGIIPLLFKCFRGGSVALGATAIGALAIGAIAIGAVSIRRLKLVESKINDLHIDRLTIGELHVRSKDISRRTRFRTSHLACRQENASASAGTVYLDR